MLDNNLLDPSFIELQEQQFSADVAAITDASTVPPAGVLGVAEGGTGAATSAGARSSLGAASSGANSDITSLSGLSTPLSVGQGGTGANSAGGARTSLGAAAAGTPGAHTITLAKITGGGTDGSITWNADGVITAFVNPT